MYKQEPMTTVGEKQTFLESQDFSGLSNKQIDMRELIHTYVWGPCVHELTRNPTCTRGSEIKSGVEIWKPF